MELRAIDDLRRSVDAGEIDTVILSLVDMHGRLQGKRFHARHFVDEVLGHRAAACNYLLAVDVDMNTAPGYSLARFSLHDRSPLPRRSARHAARAHAVIRAQHQLVQALPARIVPPHPTAVAWGDDNRTCALRVVGHRESMRVECRVPGGDANPYLAVAALIAGGLHGIDNELPLGPPFAGNAYESDLPRVPSTLREAAALWSESTLAREIFGDEVVDHYANMARVELTAFDAAVTDWERFRGCERL